MKNNLCSKHHFMQSKGPTETHWSSAPSDNIQCVVFPDVYYLYSSFIGGVDASKWITNYPNHMVTLVGYVYVIFPSLPNPYHDCLTRPSPLVACQIRAWEMFIRSSRISNITLLDVWCSYTICICGHRVIVCFVPLINLKYDLLSLQRNLQPKVLVF